MQTAAGRDIDNEQIEEISPMESNQFREFAVKFGEGMVICAESSPRFNCHGMTFAGRRTGIFESAELQKLLSDDGYVEIPRDRVLPGDIVMYIAEDGDYEHSGIVVEAPNERNLFVPKVRSKWGKYRELIHQGNRCPYNSSLLHYYRVTI